AQILRQGLYNLTTNFQTQARLLREAIDGNQGAMAAAIDQLSAQMRQRERFAQERFDRTLAGVYKKVAIVALVFLTLIVVIGVAHEVNNPVGISMTVASSLARRCEVFGSELGQGQMRRSRLVEFIESNREAANQLVANLQRAGELIQSFKQVAVDRSHADRRQFDLRESTDHIVTSLRPVLRKSQIALTLDMPAGIPMESYPGSYGQVLTNLFLNS